MQIILKIKWNFIQSVHISTLSVTVTDEVKN
jgi:hypothetical protein